MTTEQNINHRHPLFKPLTRALALVTALAPGLVLASTTFSGPFASFLTAVQGYAHGAFGVALCIVALLFGAIVGVGKNSPTSALTGVAFAIFVYFGPGVIQSIFSAGAVLH